MTSILARVLCASLASLALAAAASCSLATSLDGLSSGGSHGEGGVIANDSGGGTNEAGALDSSTSDSGVFAVAHRVDVTTPIGTGQGFFVIGDKTPAQASKLSGQLDEVAIYDKALTFAQVVAHFEAAK
jgi:hypothetical protein